MAVVEGLQYIIVDDKGTNADKFIKLFRAGYGVIFANPTANAIHYCIRPPEVQSKIARSNFEPPLVPPDMMGREPRRR